MELTPRERLLLSTILERQDVDVLIDALPYIEPPTGPELDNLAARFAFDSSRLTVGDLFNRLSQALLNGLDSDLPVCVYINVSEDYYEVSELSFPDEQGHITPVFELGEIFDWRSI
jgi:hypothetical protein